MRYVTATCTLFSAELSFVTQANCRTSKLIFFTRRQLKNLYQDLKNVFTKKDEIVIHNYQNKQKSHMEEINKQKIMLFCEHEF